MTPHGGGDSFGRGLNVVPGSGEFRDVFIVWRGRTGEQGGESDDEDAGNGCQQLHAGHRTGRRRRARRHGGGGPTRRDGRIGGQKGGVDRPGGSGVRCRHLLVRAPPGRQGGRGEGRGQSSTLPLCTARLHQPPYSRMQRRGVVGAGDDAGRHLLVQAALPCVRVGPLTRQLAPRSPAAAALAGGAGRGGAAAHASLGSCQGQAADTSAHAARWRDDNDYGDGVTDDDGDMATGDNCSRCVCSFGPLSLGPPADASARAARSPAAAAFAGSGGRGGAAAHVSLISRGVWPLTCWLALRGRRWRQRDRRRRQHGDGRQRRALCLLVWVALPSLGR